MTADWLVTALLEATLAGSAAIVLVLALRRAIGARFGAAARYRSWLLVPAAMLAPLLPARTVVQLEPFLAPDVSLTVMSVQPAVVVASAPEAGTWLLAAWLAGVCVLALMLWRQQRRYVAAMRPGEPGRVGLHPGLPRWRRSELTGTPPALIGALRPWLLVPADFEQRYDTEERTLVLAHEHRHLVRGDALANLLVAACRCLQWFNPLVHLAAARMRFDQELACDADVVRAHPGERRRYADAMLKTALAANALPVGCHWHATHPLEERIAMLRHPVLPRTRALLGNALLATLLASASLIAWAAQPARVVQDLEAPMAAAQRGVLVDVLVGADGRAREVRIADAAADLDDPAVQAALQIATLHPHEPTIGPGGKPIEAWQQMSFELDGERFPDEELPARMAGRSFAGIAVSYDDGDAQVAKPPRVVSAVAVPGTTLDSDPRKLSTIAMNVLVDAAGVPKEATLDAARSSGTLDARSVERARDAVLGWRFQPGRNAAGEPVEARIVVPVQVAPGTDEVARDAAFDWRFELKLDVADEAAEC